MKKNRKITIFVSCVFVSALFFGLSPNVFAQRSRRTRRTAASAVAKVQVRQAAEKVAIQIKNVSKFVFVLGGVAKGIEDLDKDIREGRASREVADQNRQFKSDILRSIRALRAGLVKIEVDFRAKPALRKYLIYVRGLTDESARAEDLALAGQFSNSGKELLLIVERLADVLVEMP